MEGFRCQLDLLVLDLADVGNQRCFEMVVDTHVKGQGTVHLLALRLTSCLFLLNDLH